MAGGVVLTIDDSIDLAHTHTQRERGREGERQRGKQVSDDETSQKNVSVEIVSHGQDHLSILSWVLELGQRPLQVRERVPHHELLELALADQLRQLVDHVLPLLSAVLLHPPRHPESHHV